MNLITNPLMPPSHIYFLSERGSPGVTASSKHQPLDSPPDQRPLRHVAHYKACYKLVSPSIMAVFSFLFHFSYKVAS